MLAAGLRVPARPRAHETVGIYGEATIETSGAQEFQRMRRRRNKAEYDDIVLGSADLAIVPLRCVSLCSTRNASSPKIFVVRLARSSSS